MKIWLYLLARKLAKGFTLLELLMASVLTFLVVSATGYAVLIMTRDNIASSVSSDLQFNTNRASDFIVDEIKQASFISINPSVLPTGCPALTSGEQFVLALAVGSSTTVNVVYYTKTPPSGVWRGPSSIYRCGLGLAANGAYTGSIDTTPRILVDSISTTVSACPTQTPTLTRFPATPAAGFYICHPPDLPSGSGDQRLSQPAEKVVVVNVTATSTDLTAQGLNTQSRGSSSGTYSVVTKVFARSGAP
jgi:Tfp pilus assembly protein PilW